MRTHDPFSLEGKNAIVTGGAMGIGLGIASCFTDAGANVLIVDRDDEAATRAVKELEGRGTKAMSLQLDITEPEAGDRMVESCVDVFGSLDILVNNAGIFPTIPMMDIEPEAFERVFRLNVHALAFASQAAARRMIAQQTGGRIINVGSIDSFHPSLVGLAAYDASKGAVHMFTKNLALELAPHGILVTMIAPGGVETPGASRPLEGSGMTEEQAAAMRQAIIDSKIPLKRMGIPDDIGKVAVFLASSAADYMTGTSVIVDGGMLLG